MGGGNSKSSMIIDTKTLNKTTSNFLTKNQTSQSQSGLSIQEIDLEKAKFLSCTSDISQDADIEATAIQKFNNESTTDLKTMLKSAVENDLKKQADQSSGWGSTSIAEKKADEMKVKTEIENIIETNITTENLNEQIQNVTSIQKINSGETVFDPCGYQSIADAGFALNSSVMRACQECEYEKIERDGTVTRKNCSAPVCKIDQNVAMKLMAEQIGNNVTKAVQQNEVINDVVNKAKQKTDQSTQGLGGAFGEFFSGLTGPMKIIAAVICVALCVGLIFMMSPAGQNATRAAASKM